MPPTSKRRRPILTQMGQSFVRWFFRIALTVFYRIRVHGLANYPENDGFLLCSNHQSFLDPIVLGVVCPRPVNYLGRKTLFKFRPLGWFLRMNDTIPIDRDANSIGGMKETIRRLKRGESVVMVPEGTRSNDGQLQPLLHGFCPLARRTKATLMPVAIVGAFEAYPRQNLLPIPGNIHSVMGKPIPFSEYQNLTDQQVANLLAERIKTCFELAQAHRNGEERNPDSENPREGKLELL